MYSIAFPDMVSNTNTKIISDHEATWSNLKLLLLSAKQTLFGDPYFGSNLKKLMFEQNIQIIKQKNILIIDDIYTTILSFMPQITLKRNDIEIISNRETVYIKIKCTNLLDYQVNTYTLNMMDIGEK